MRHPRRLFILAIPLVLLGILVAIPLSPTIQREQTIIAAPQMIFTFVADLHRWPEWRATSPNFAPVPVPRFGKGAHANEKNETITVTEWSENRFAAYEQKSDDQPVKAGRFELLDAPQGATLRWTIERPLPSNPIFRPQYLFEMWRTQRRVKNELQNLKTICEKSAAADIKAPWQIPARDALPKTLPATR